MNGYLAKSKTRTRNILHANVIRGQVKVLELRNELQRHKLEAATKFMGPTSTHAVAQVQGPQLWYVLQGAE